MNPPVSVSRRAFCGLAVGTAAAVSVPSLATAAPALPARSPSAAPVRAAVDFLDTMTHRYDEVSDTSLPQSYADELGLFSTAFVYDAALAALAALAARRTSLARDICDGLRYAQTHDPAFNDGRLRQGYNVGPFTFYDGVRNEHGLVLPDGKANIGWQFGFLGTAVGDMAWPGMALAQTYRATKRRDYLRGAQAIGDWIITYATNRGSLGGFSFGRNGSDQPVPNCSTEHNIDCVAFFRMLDQLDPSARWRRAYRRAASFVDRMWESDGGFYYTGSNDGSTINRSPIPLDPQTWSSLALGTSRAHRSLDYIRPHLGATDLASQPHSQLPDGTHVSGVTFSTASLTSTASYNGVQVNPTGVWLEGTAQFACALKNRSSRKDIALARWYLHQIEWVQENLGGGQHVGGEELDFGGVVAASSLIDSGFGFGYFQVQHTGATAWMAMAEIGVNPMRLYRR